MNISGGEEFINREGNQLKFHVKKLIVQHMKKLLVANTKKWDYTYPNMYTNEYLSSYKYLKLYFDI